MGRTGFLVKTSTGKEGAVYHDDKLINGKLQVHLKDGTKLLCREETLETIGFTD